MMASLMQFWSEMFRKLRAIKIFSQLFSGNHIFDPLVEYRQVETFSIQTKGDLLNIDGENIGQHPDRCFGEYPMH